MISAQILTLLFNCLCTILDSKVASKISQVIKYIIVMHQKYSYEILVVILLYESFCYTKRKLYEHHYNCTGKPFFLKKIVFPMLLVSIVGACSHDTTKHQLKETCNRQHFSNAFENARGLIVIKVSNNIFNALLLKPIKLCLMRNILPL